MSVNGKRNGSRIIKKSEGIRKDVRLGKQQHEAKYIAIKHFNEEKTGLLDGCLKD